MVARHTVIPKPHARLSERLGAGALTTNAVMVFVFLYLPVLVLIIFSFNSSRSVALFTGFSTEWYSRLATNQELLDAARNSLTVGISATLGSTLIGTMTALAMDRFRFRGRTAVDANLYLPIVIPEIVMGISLLLFFNQALFPFIRSFTSLQPSTGLATITLAHIAFDIPFVYIIVRARLADFDKALEEAAKDLGADAWQTFRRITLPLLMPGIIGGALMAFTLSLDDYLITVFTKGPHSQTMPLYIFSLIRRGITPEINALSTLLLVGSMGLVALSLAAQSGVRLYTLAMGLGARAGLVLLGAYGLLSGLFLGSIDARLVLYLLFATLPFLNTKEIFREWQVEQKETNLAGRLLSFLAGLLILAALFVSLFLLLQTR